jgi:hypothetical protein
MGSNSRISVISASVSPSSNSIVNSISPCPLYVLSPLTSKASMVLVKKLFDALDNCASTSCKNESQVVCGPIRILKETSVRLRIIVPFNRHPVAVINESRNSFKDVVSADLPSLAFGLLYFVQLVSNKLVVVEAWGFVLSDLAPLLLFLELLIFNTHTVSHPPVI